MKKTIVVAGKGGTGKTTLTSLLVRYIIEEIKTPVLAIDADPNESLGSYLGINGKIETMMDIVDMVLSKPEAIPAGMTKERFINLQIQQSIVEEKDFDFLSMGRPEGPGCYCYANNLLKGLVQKVKDSYDYTVIDNEAGLEHLSRRITPQIDVLLIVCGIDLTSFKTAMRVLNIVKKLKIKVQKKFLLANRIKDGFAFGIEKVMSDEKMEFLGEIPEDEKLIRLSMEGKSIFELKKDSVSLKQTRDIFGNIF
ncbi:MAG: AAA family ATPase [Candidatus Omnitrophota bacterium]